MQIRGSSDVISTMGEGKDVAVGLGLDLVRDLDCDLDLDRNCVLVLVLNYDYESESFHSLCRPLTWLSSYLRSSSSFVSTR